MLFSGQNEFWYVLFVFDGYEQKITDSINKHYNNESLVAFLPKKDKWFIGQGKRIKESVLLFPGYVFIETHLTSGEFVALTKQFLGNSREIIRILCNGDAGDIAVKEHERLAWSHLLGKENCVETSVGFIENEKIYIEYGPLKGKEGMIKKLDRHKREAIIEMDFMGRMINVNVAVQLIKKIV